ncbi:hypothetical protein [Methanobrevibacter filiformis]|uniref:Uncharacterized protein n=1 Tax=Methanobrevibacter filiformis TaxID=55758 RepID=A0A166BK99_9EURY|nr:hypothetical protein [Methanobrevibacter filiformis]KZX13474.1 hypothetical protein MBFIL_09960 [Methanobrevibacter filiformis]
MSEIGDNVLFKNDNGKELELDQKFIGLKTRDNGILTVNFRTPKDLMEKIMSFFTGFKDSEPICVDIGGTGDISCYFKGISPLLVQTDNVGFEYSFLSVTLQELKETVPEEPPACGCL